VEKQKGLREKDIHKGHGSQKKNKRCRKIGTKMGGSILSIKDKARGLRLQTLEGEEVPYSWNQHKMQKY
jgi:hypothetical protein